MRKVLTGYTISFNRRCGRRGYLYQNRYKSMTAIEPLGREALLHISTKCCHILVLTPEKDLKPDKRVHVCLDPNRVHLFGPGQQEEDSNGF